MPWAFATADKLASSVQSAADAKREVAVLRGCVDVANAFSEFLSDEEKASLKAKALGIMNSMWQEVERRCCCEHRYRTPC